jgi:hypothetical protein
LSHIIDLTLDDELDDVPNAYAETLKALQSQAQGKPSSTSSLRRLPPGMLLKRPPPGTLPEGSLGEVTPERKRKWVSKESAPEEQSDSRYVLRKKTARCGSRPPEILSSDDELPKKDGPDEVSGEETWTLSEEDGPHAECAKKRNTGKAERMRAKRLEKRQKKLERQQNAKPAIVSTAIMFTIPEAIAALEKPGSAHSVRYDLPTSEFLAYPAEQSYHLGAMGRYRHAFWAWD